MKLIIKLTNNENVTEHFGDYLQSLKENGMAIFKDDVIIRNDGTDFKVINIIISPKRNEIIVLASILPKIFDKENSKKYPYYH
jgi:hypothetical protein